MATRKPLYNDGKQLAEMPDGDAVPLAADLVGGVPLIKVYTVTTNGNGEWTANFGSDFSQVDSVIPTAISGSDIDSQRFASLSSSSNTSASGRVVITNTIVSIILGGGKGLKFAGSGVQVRVTVIGKKPV